MIAVVDLCFAYFVALIFALSIHLNSFYNHFFHSSRLIYHGNEHSIQFSRQRSALVRSKRHINHEELPFSLPHSSKVSP